MGWIKCLAPGHHGPDNSDVLVGQGNGCNVLVASPDKTDQPGIFLLFGFSKADDRTSAVDQQGSEITITALTDPQESLLPPLKSVALRPRRGMQPTPGRS